MQKETPSISNAQYDTAEIQIANAQTKGGEGRSDAYGMLPVRSHMPSAQIASDLMVSAKDAGVEGQWTPLPGKEKLQLDNESAKRIKSERDIVNVENKPAKKKQ